MKSQTVPVNRSAFDFIQRLKAYIEEGVHMNFQEYDIVYVDNMEERRLHMSFQTSKKPKPRKPAGNTTTIQDVFEGQLSDRDFYTF